MVWVRHITGSKFPRGCGHGVAQHLLLEGDRLNVKTGFALVSGSALLSYGPKGGTKEGGLHTCSSKENMCYQRIGT